MPMTEVKTEAAIDRLTSAAVPRQRERVPAGAKFNYELVYNVYLEKDIDWLKELFLSLYLVEGDYLGGQGSRGYGQIKFEPLMKEKVRWDSFVGLGAEAKGKLEGYLNFLKEGHSMEQIYKRFCAEKEAA